MREHCFGCCLVESLDAPLARAGHPAHGRRRYVPARSTATWGSSQGSSGGAGEVRTADSGHLPTLLPPCPCSCLQEVLAGSTATLLPTCPRSCPQVVRPPYCRLVHAPARRKYGQRRFGGLVRSTLQGGQTAAQPKSPVSELTDKTELTREQFEGLLGQIDKGLRALPATAQVGAEMSSSLGRHSARLLGLL